jgi:ATP-binding cassette subfamily B protein
VGAIRDDLNLVFLILSLITMLNLDWRLSLVVIAFLPLPSLIGAWAAREQAQRERRLIGTWSHLYPRLHETLGGILTVKGFAQERTEINQFLDGSRAGNAIVYNGVRRDTVTNSTRGFSATRAPIGAIGVGAYFISRGEMTVGTLVAFLGFIGGLVGPVQGLTGDLSIRPPVRRLARSAL